MTKKEKELIREVLKVSTTLSDFEIRVKIVGEREKLKFSRALIWGYWDGYAHRPKTFGGVTSDNDPDPDMISDYEEGLYQGQEMFKQVEKKAKARFYDASEL